MSEQLALKQSLGDGRAVDGHKWFVRPAAILVDGPRNQFFSRAAFPGDQDRRIAPGNSGNELIDVEHGLTLSDHAVVDVELFVQPAILTSQPLHMPRVLDSERSDVSQRRDQLEKVCVEVHARRTGVEVDDAQELVTVPQEALPGRILPSVPSSYPLPERLSSLRTSLESTARFSSRTRVRIVWLA